MMKSNFLIVLHVLWHTSSPALVRAGVWVWLADYTATSMEGVTLICDGGSKKDLARERPEKTVWTKAPVTYT